METITAPVQFLEAMGDIALEARLMVLNLMPFLVILIFFWGYVSFLFGLDKKINLNKYVFTPLFLFLMLRFYPTVIDVTGQAYAIIINTFDKPEYKDFHLEYLGVKEELDEYKNTAEEALDNYLTQLRGRRTEIEHGDRRLILDEKTRQAHEAVRQELTKDINKALDMKSGVIGSALSSLWDFFSLPTIRIIRYVIDVVRNVFLCLLVIFGCFAIFFECIPVFKGILNKWFKFYTAVTFWALTVCVLDGMFLAFAEAGVSSAKYFYENANVLGTLQEKFLRNGALITRTDPSTTVTDFAIKWYGYGGSEGINTAISIVMVISYCMVPFITSLYIGGESAGMFMSKVLGVGSMAVRQSMSTATNTVASIGKVAGGSQGGEQAKLAANVASIATAMNSGKS
jgi:hypothetical protein